MGRKFAGKTGLETSVWVSNGTTFFSGMIYTSTCANMVSSGGIEHDETCV